MKNPFILWILLLAFLSESGLTGQYSVSVSKEGVSVSLEEYKSAFRNPMKGFREFFSPGVDKAGGISVSLRNLGKRVYAMEYA